MPDQMTSEALLHKAARGDGSAFKALVERHQSKVINLVYRILGDRQKSEDIAQEVFLKVWQAASTYQGKSKFTTWLYRVAINLSLNEIRSRKRHSWLQCLHLYPLSKEPVGESGETPTAEDLLIAQELGERIRAALQSLPENQRIALILRRYDGLSYDEISRVMNCSLSIVEALLVRAKRAVQASLKKK